LFGVKGDSYIILIEGERARKRGNGVIGQRYRMWERGNKDGKYILVLPIGRV
jgi:hypothetical protein